MVRMMATEDSVTGPINIGNPGEFTMLELAHEILDITGSKSKIVYLPLPADDPVKRKPDITLAREKLNSWEPVVPLREGLLKTVEYFEKLLTEKV
jgi:UDP-glucuronate decarboxylase